MKKIFLPLFAIAMLLLTSCSNDDISITTTPKIRTLTYVINTQSMYDELGITSELNSNYLNKGYSIGVYTFVYDSNGDKVASKSSTTSSLGTFSEEFNLEEGNYTFVTYEALVGSGNTPSWSGDDRLSTLAFEDKSSSDYHCVSGTVQKLVTIKGEDPTEIVTPETTRVLLTFNINLKNMYDEFGVTDDLTNRILRDKNSSVGIFTYIYNSQGDLVDSVKTQQFSLNNATQIRSIPKGDYTILTIETLVDPTDNMPTCWRFDDIEKLTTVKMYQVYSNPYWNEVVGEATTNVTLTGNKEISITNKAIGSIVNFLAYNFENTPYAHITFGTTDILDYYSFNPQLPREERFTEDLSESGRFTSRGMSMTPEESTSKYKSVYFLESKIDWDFAVQPDINENSWYFWEEGKASLEDGKNYYAGFYYLYEDDEYVYYRTYFGDIEGFNSWKLDADEYVNNLTLFEQPYITWGGTVSAVKSYMSGYRVGNNGNLVESNGNYILWYYGKYKEAEIDYYFTSSTGGLTDAVLFFDADKVGEDDLSKAFTEMGYEFIISGDGYFAYSTKDSESFVWVQLNSQNYWVVDYFSASSNSAPRRTVKKDFPTFAPRQKGVLKAKNFDKADIVNQLRHCENTMKLYFK